MGNRQCHRNHTHGTSASSAADLFTYAAAPTVSAVAPPSGLALGGQSVIITGTHLALATAVDFGSTPASSFTINSSTQVTAVAPVGAAGVVDVRVVAPGGALATSKADQFTYMGPAVTAVAPNSGPSWAARQSLSREPISPAPRG